MDEKKTDSGSVTLKISVENNNEIREITDEEGVVVDVAVDKIPLFKYTVTIGINLKSKVSGEVDSNERVILDKATGEYVLVRKATDQTEMEI